VCSEIVESVTKISPEEYQVHLASGATIHCARGEIATGSVADQEAIPGAQLHTVFPCDVEGA